MQRTSPADRALTTKRLTRSTRNGCRSCSGCNRQSQSAAAVIGSVLAVLSLVVVVGRVWSHMDDESVILGHHAAVEAVGD